MDHDIDQILREVEQDASKTRIVPLTDPDLEAFQEHARQMTEIAKRNNWPVVIAGFTPVQKENGLAIGATFSVHVAPGSVSETFAVAGLRGVAMSMAFVDTARHAKVLGSMLEALL